METPPRHYIALAFLPIVLAAATLVGLYIYQQGATERRDRWQKPEAVLDSLGVRAGMRVAEWSPPDTYFLERLEERVGTDGVVYAVQPPTAVAEVIEESLPGVEVVTEPPSHVDAALLIDVSLAGEEGGGIVDELRQAGAMLAQGARLGLIGPRRERDRFLSKDRLAQIGEDKKLRPLGEEGYLDRQFFLVLVKE
jgi:hypothetical protein